MSAKLDDLSAVLLWKDRAWSEVETPLVLGAEDEDWTAILRRNGWWQSTTIGSEDGIGVDLYERDPKGETCRYQWLVSYNTFSLCQTIVIERWQDLIDFLAHVSTTMLAVVLPPDASSVLHDFFEETPYRQRKRAREHEDWQRAQQKRRENPQPVESSSEVDS
jgi:hypothetical protein